MEKVMLKAKLIQIKSSHNNLRTKEVEGEIDKLPTIGESFLICGAGIEFGTRYVMTTPVQSLEKIDNKTFNFKTENSEYTLMLEKAIN